ncbi:glycoside-pentoside-hexuronide (GPH):cation symporter [Sphingopyxis sp.]|jgi:GPH family glycoside/pentoside/hexuronide:cation symporter|uniref:MFS transporter n=1 Tax=Sphingopyxis sp. TaxID=1908224 RepID=UPI002DF65CCE|nr:glycoside-pentoside-hexuronide (GPH):cation symporter [Sphingopyxis sp.]
MTANAAGARLGLGRIIGYGAGDFAFNLSFTFASLFLLYFYTDVLELDPGTAGLIIMVALVWEGITDPVIGMLANRTRSRWGRYRPYLLFGSVPLALSVAAMFLPLGLSGGALVAYCFATHLVYRTVFTFVNIPYIALSAQLTQDSDARGQLAAARMLFAISCGLLLASLTLPLAKAFGGGQAGFFLVSVVYSVLASIILFVTFAATREDVADVGERHPGFADMLATMRHNRAFLMLLLATVAGLTGYTMSGKALIYYLKYWVGSEAAVTSGLVVTLGAAAIAMLPWMIIARRTSKRFVWITGACFNLAAYLFILLAAPRGGAMLWTPLVLVGIGNSAFILTFWSMLPDTVEYGEWKTGLRAEGAIFGLIAFSQKIALGIGTGMIGIIMGWIGYVPNRPQSEATLHGIVLLYGLGPFLLFLASIVAIWFYPVSGPTHRRIVRVIERRRSRYKQGLQA